MCSACRQQCNRQCPAGNVRLLSCRCHAASVLNNMHFLIHHGLIQLGVVQDLTVLACYLAGVLLIKLMGHAAWIQSKLRAGCSQTVVADSVGCMLQRSALVHVQVVHIQGYADAGQALMVLCAEMHFAGTYCLTFANACCSYLSRF